jgi:arylsulfatase A-like enzyme
MTTPATRPRLALLALLLPLVAGMAGCSGGTSTTSPAAVRPTHLIIVTIDTLRADRLGAYGNTSVPTPHFDQLAREGVRAAEATAHVPITRPSHTSLFTGRYPPEHGVRDNISLPLATSIPTLGQTLQDAGFATAAFVSSFVLDSSAGLNRGFAHYDDAVDTGTGDEVVSISSAQRRGDATLTRVE